MSLLDKITGQSDMKNIHVAAPIPERLRKPERVAIITSDKVEDIEFFYPYYRFTEAGYEVDVITLEGGAFEAKHGLGLPESLSITSVQPANYALLYLPGGQAPSVLRKNEDVLNFVRTFASSGKPVAAICHGPQILVSAGLVQGRTLAAWPEVGKEIQDAGGMFADEALQIDGQFITARMPGDLPRHMDGALRALEQASKASAISTRSAA